VETAPKASGCFLGGTQEIFGSISRDLLGGTGKAEDAKLPDAGPWENSPEAVPNGQGGNGERWAGTMG